MVLLPTLLLALATFTLSGPVNVLSKGWLDARALGEVFPLVLPLTRRILPRTSMLSRLVASHRAPWQGGAAVPLTSTYDAMFLMVNVTFGNQTFELFLDTGSSDTWVIAHDFRCFDKESDAPIDQAECLLGPGYIPTPTFKQMPDENFNITYGDGELLNGILGTERTTLGGITVLNQTFALVNYAGWVSFHFPLRPEEWILDEFYTDVYHQVGDGYTSGLLGLAYPAITSAYRGNDFHADGKDAASC